MLTVTDAAAEHLCSLLQDVNAAEYQSARFELEGRDVVMTLSELQEKDTTFQHNGRTVLLLDEQTSTVLADEQLDVKVTEEGPQLVFSST